MRASMKFTRRHLPRRSRVTDHAELLSKTEIHALLGCDDPLILEIGCNDGSDTAEFLDEFPDCHLHCFECDPRAVSDFRGSIKDPRCQLYELAISDHTGVASLRMSGGTHPEFEKEDWDFSSSLLEPTGHLTVHPWVTFDRTCEVQTKTLDDWAEAVIPDAVVDFVWIDVQGAEHLVFGGGSSTFGRARFCYFEYSESELYRGQRGLDALLRQLSTYRLLATYQSHNALVRNTTFSSKGTV